MRLKDPLNYGSWIFFIGEESEDDSQLLRIPEQGTMNSRKNITRAVMATFESLARQGKPEYKQVAMEEAQMMNLSYDAYVAKVIEHQICIREGGVGGGKCYPSGIGDKLHSFAEKIDAKIDKAPKLVKKVFEKVVKSTVFQGKKVSPGRKVRLGGCSACGGSRSFSRAGKNMGRAGRMQ